MWFFEFVFFGKTNKQKKPSHVAPTIDSNMSHVRIFDKDMYAVSFGCEIFQFCKVNFASTQHTMTAVSS